METLEKKSFLPSRDLDQFVVRLPDGLRDHIANEAKNNKRSMNSEIVLQLQKAYPGASSNRVEELQAIRERNDTAARAGFMKLATGQQAARSAPPVTLKELAGRLNMDRSACRQYILKLGYKPSKMRTVDSGFQLALTLTAAEATAIQATRAADGYCAAPA